MISWGGGAIDGAAFAPPIGTTNYVVTADVCNGQCPATDNVDVTINPMPVVFFAADTLVGCDPLVVTFENQSTILGNNCVGILVMETLLLDVELLPIHMILQEVLM